MPQYQEQQPKHSRQQ
jgi:hypothetical protein